MATSHKLSGKCVLNFNTRGIITADVPLDFATNTQDKTRFHNK